VTGELLFQGECFGHGWCQGELLFQGEGFGHELMTGVKVIFCFREKAKEIIKKRGGSLTEDEEEATHIVHPKVELNTELYARYRYRPTVFRIRLDPDSYCQAGSVFGIRIRILKVKLSYKNLLFPQIFHDFHLSLKMLPNKSSLFNKIPGTYLIG